MAEDINEEEKEGGEEISGTVGEEQEIFEWQEELSECQKQRDEYLAGWQRARADLLNYKKKESERVSSFLERAAEDFVLEILPALDSFDLAEKSLSSETKKDNNIRGMLQIKAQLADSLKKMGVKEIASVGEEFDPSLHEAAAEIEGQEGQAPGSIVEELQKGYTLGGRVIRPAKVKTAK